MDPKLLEGLGYAIVCWAIVEMQVSTLFRLLIQSEKSGGALHVVTENVSQTTLTGWIRTLIDYMGDGNDPVENDVREVLTEVDELRAERNMFVHGTWQPGHSPGSALVHTVKLERNAIIQHVVVTTDDLAEFVKHSLEVGVKMNKILIRFGLNS